MEEERPLQSIPDDQLLSRLAELTSQARRVDADVVAHIGEVDERRLFARQAFASMFAYCTGALHLSEAEAYLRILAARASREHPMLLTMLADGRIHLTGIALLAPHLTRGNRDALLQRATHRSKREIEKLIAEIAPRPDVPVVVRKIPERRAPCTELPLVPSSGEAPIAKLLRPDGVGVPVGPAPLVPRPVPQVPPAIIQPLSPGRYKVQFTASAELNDKLQRLQALMGSRGPEADLAAIIEQAVTEKLERLEACRFARTSRKAFAKTETATETKARTVPSSRHIPASVRRAVRQRDGSQCRYVDEHGRRCPERDRLEYHHRHPYGLGGDHSLENIRLMCRGHNAYLAECDYGREAMARHRRASGRPSQASAG